MAIIDIILLVCFIPAIVQGLTKGFIKQVAGIVAIVAGAWAAYSFSNLLSEWMASAITVSNPKVLTVVSYIVIALIVILILAILGEAITKALQAISLGPANRLLGLIFSIMKTALLLGLIILLFEYLNGFLHLADKDTLQNTVLYDSLKRIACKLFPFIQDMVGGLGNV